MILPIVSLSFKSNSGRPATWDFMPISAYLGMCLMPDRAW